MKKALLALGIIAVIVIVGFLLSLLAFKSGFQETTDLWPTPSAFLSSKPVRVIFVGDIMLSRQIGKQMAIRQDFSFPFLLSRDFLSQADFVFGNLEGPISDQGQNQGSIYSFRADPRALEGLKKANFKILSLANNHIWDWGKEALLQTLSLFEDQGLEAVGIGQDYQSANQPVVWEKDGIRLAFFALTNLYPASLEATDFSPGVSRSDFGVLRAQIENARLNNLADFFVVSLHWGEEYGTQPGSWQRAEARALIEAGADLIIGHHPHVVQDFERYRNKWIFYSLGNFVFDQNFSKATMESLAIVADFPQAGPGITVEAFQVRLNSSFQPEILEAIDLASVANPL